MKKVDFIIDKLREEYGEVKVPLQYHNPFELLIAVILSAQCTDGQVNKVTPKLFKKFERVEDFASADIKEIEELIKPTGFYKVKAKYIKKSSEIILNEFKGEVPSKMSDLLKLPGVGRKTANVILHHIFKIKEGIVVDTHVGRLGVRLGLVSTNNSKAAVKIERELMDLFPVYEWENISLYFIYHGRKVCTARRVFCDECVISKVCPSYKNIKEYKG